MKMTKEQAAKFDDGFYDRMFAMFKESGKPKYDKSGEMARIYFEDNKDLLEALGFGALKLFVYIACVDMVKEAKRGESSE